MSNYYSREQIRVRVISAYFFPLQNEIFNHLFLDDQ